MPGVSLSLPNETVEILKEMAWTERTTRSAIVNDLIIEAGKAKHISIASLVNNENNEQ